MRFPIGHSDRPVETSWMASRVSVHCSAARAYGPLRCLSFDLLSAVSVALRPSAGRERRRRHVVRDDVRCGAVEVQPSTCKARDMLTRPFHHHPSRLPVCPRTRTTTFRSSKNFKFFFSPGCACASKTRTIFPLWHSRSFLWFMLIIVTIRFALFL